MHKEILRVLSGIESLLTDILLELRNRRGQAPAPHAADPAERSDKWLQEGIDNILGFQAGGKRGEKA